jgi:regulatory protein
MFLREAGARVKTEPSLRDRALRYLAQREHSRAELARKLSPHAQSEDELNALLDALEARRQLSDERFADARASKLSRKYGSSRILQDLKARGVDGELAQQTAAAARTGDLERAREIWRKKFREPATTREAQAKQMRFLQARGFSFEIIRQVIKGGEELE